MTGRSSTGGFWRMFEGGVHAAVRAHVAPSGGNTASIMNIQTRRQRRTGFSCPALCFAMLLFYLRSRPEHHPSGAAMFSSVREGKEKGRWRESPGTEFSQVR